MPPDRILPCRHCTLLRPVWSLDISLPVSPAHPFQTGSAGVPDQKRASAPPCSGRTAVFHPGGAPCSMQMPFLPQSLRHKTEAAQNLSDSFSRHAIHDSLHILSLRKAFLIRAFFYRYPLFRAKSPLPCSRRRKTQHPVFLPHPCRSSLRHKAIPRKTFQVPKIYPGACIHFLPPVQTPVKDLPVPGNFCPVLPENVFPHKESDPPSALCQNPRERKLPPHPR